MIIDCFFSPAPGLASNPASPFSHPPNLSLVANPSQYSIPSSYRNLYYRILPALPFSLPHRPINRYNLSPYRTPYARRTFNPTALQISPVSCCFFPPVVNS